MEHDNKPKKLQRGLSALSNMLLQEKPPAVLLHYHIRFSQDTGDDEVVRDKAIYKALAALDEAILTKPDHYKSALCTLMRSHCGEKCSCNHSYDLSSQKSAAAESTPKPPAEPPTRPPLEASPVLIEGVHPLKAPFKGWSNGALIALSVGLVTLLGGLVAAFLVIIWEDTVERDEPPLKSGTPSKLDRRCWQIW